jgi:DnaJ-class molecular chaperone
MASDSEKVCSKCKGSGKLQDDVYDWVIIDCFVCNGTGKEPKWYTKLMNGEEPKPL